LDKTIKDGAGGITLALPFLFSRFFYIYSFESAHSSISYHNPLSLRMFGKNGHGKPVNH
jgi:hypothetical protein